MIRAKISFDVQTAKYVAKLEKNLSDAVDRSAIMVQNRTKELLNSTGKSYPAQAGMNVAKTAEARRTQPKFDRSTRKSMGVYWYGEPLHRWVQASVKGTPPHKQTGTLQRSIMTERMPGKIASKIGPAKMLVYARRLEIGDLDRPYLLPAFESLQPKILKLLAAAVKETSV